LLHLNIQRYGCPKENIKGERAETLGSQEANIIHIFKSSVVKVLIVFVLIFVFGQNTWIFPLEFSDADQSMDGNKMLIITTSKYEKGDFDNFNWIRHAVVASMTGFDGIDHATKLETSLKSHPVKFYIKRKTLVENL